MVAELADEVGREVLRRHPPCPDRSEQRQGRPGPRGKGVQGIAALVWGWGIVVATTFCWAVLPLLHLLLTRVDLWSTAAATVAIAAWTRDRDAPCGVALASGLAFKLWPALFVPLLLDRRRCG